MRRVVFQKVSEEARVFPLAAEPLHRDRIAPIQRDGHADAEIAPSELLAHETEREGISAASAFFFRGGQRPQTQAAALLQETLGKPLSRIFFPIDLFHDRVNFLLGEFICHPLERQMGFVRPEVHAHLPSRLLTFPLELI